MKYIISKTKETYYLLFFSIPSSPPCAPVRRIASKATDSSRLLRKSHHSPRCELLPILVICKGPQSYAAPDIRRSLKWKRKENFTARGEKTNSLGN